MQRPGTEAIRTQIAAHSVGRVFSFVFWLFVVLVVSRFGFGGWVWVLIASVPDRCTRLTQTPKREITKNTNSQNTKRTCDQSTKQLFPKKVATKQPEPN